VQEPDRTTAQPVTLSRRAALKSIGAGVGAVAVWPYLSDSAAAAFGAIQAGQPPPKLVFLSAAQYATLDALTEALIPADDHSPGARAARVADYIDLLLAESDGETQRTWTAGLASLDDECRRRFNAPYAQLGAVQSTELLTDISRNETNPTTALERFFKVTKDAAIRGYYTSEIGIHKELEYKGNVMLGEFVGCTHPEHGYVPPSK
jgi:Gluconate 2-dehydrogenase subunit 3